MEPCPGGAPTLWDESDLKRAFVALSHLKKILRLRKKQGLDVFNHTQGRCWVLLGWDCLYTDTARTRFRQENCSSTQILSLLGLSWLKLELPCASKKWATNWMAPYSVQEARHKLFTWTPPKKSRRWGSDPSPGKSTQPSLPSDPTVLRQPRGVAN